MLIKTLALAAMLATSVFVMGCASSTANANGGATVRCAYYPNADCYGGPP